MKLLTRRVMVFTDYYICRYCANRGSVTTMYSSITLLQEFERDLQPYLLPQQPAAIR